MIISKSIIEETEISTAQKLLPYSFAKTWGLIAAPQNDSEVIKVYHLPDLALDVLAEVKRFFRATLQLQLVNKTEFQQHLTQIYQSTSSMSDMAENMGEAVELDEFNEVFSEDLLADNDDAPIIRLINAIFTQAIKQKASDIHIETYEQRVVVRNRIDGVLQEVLEVQRAVAPLLTSRVKVMAKLDIAEKRLPQDGRIALTIGEHNIDVRVSTLPSNHGERIVLRILDKAAAQLNLHFLGMVPSTLQIFKEIISAPHGIILVTGPTGSGKTTSLYAMLTELNEVSRNILTIEDPIEYDLPGIGQTQVNSRVNMTFAKGLRAILRQDPDIVMIGEIRDLETAQIAIQASLTGHLVLSTLHTNTAVGALTRLQDMGIEPFLLSSSIVGLIAQRLVRKLCVNCKKRYKVNAVEKKLISMDKKDIVYSKICQPIGCLSCNNSGYVGRTGIYEVINVDEDLRRLINRNESMQVMEQYLRQKVPSIRDDGFKRVLAGDTSIAEILRVT